MERESLQRKIGRTIQEHVRVLRITKKPELSEVSSVSKIAGLGIILIGLAGFLIYMVASFLR